MTSFALAALLLAGLGIYSIVAFSVASRVQEMAIRIALGSQRGDILRLVLISGAKLAAVGAVIGRAGAAGGRSGAQLPVPGEPVRSGCADTGSHWRVLSGAGGLDDAGAPGIGTQKF
jgi:hypothetical protein